MISKERLEELIEQGATVWVIRSCGIFKRELKNRTFDFELLGVLVSNSGIPYERWFYIDLFETKEEAEWHKEFGCIERTEILKLPTWEEFLKTEETFMFKSKRNQIISLFRDENTIYLEDETWNILREDLTKENYTLACRKCKELFLGERK